MYSFTPTATIPASHEGFVFICIICVALFLVAIITEDLNWARVFFVIFLIPTMGIAYGVSYHWTSQEPTVFKNEQVVGEFVGFQPEGYREKSGKSMVDRHYMYVVYRVNGENIILQSSTGKTYPERVTLYKN
jgi:hypothetical protein